MTAVERLASFAVSTPYEELSDAAREQLKIRILDTLGCAIGAADAEPVRRIGSQIRECGAPTCTMVGGRRAEPDRTALYNGALARYLDFNDSYLAKGETCHPSDNLAALLASAEYADGDGRRFLCAMAIAYQVQCRLSDVAPVRAAGFDHTVQGAYAVSAGISRALDLDMASAANAIAISGTALNALRVTRTGTLSNWKGLAYPFMAACSTQIAFLAQAGITGPCEVFEGEKGLMDAITGLFEIDWQREDLDRVKYTILKKYNAEIHSQTAIEGVLSLRRRHGFKGGDIERVEVDTFDVAFHIIGGGDEGDKTSAISTKEQADHSLPYVLAVAALDGRVMPDQYETERIRRADVQQLLRRIHITPNSSYSQRFPQEMPCRVRISLRDGRTLLKEVRDYPGFFSQPVSWNSAYEKFENLAGPHTTEPLRRAIADAVADLENIRVSELTKLLAAVGAPDGKAESGRADV